MSNALHPSARSPLGSVGLNSFSPLTALVMFGQVLLFLILIYLDVIIYFPLLCIAMMVLYASLKNLLVWLPIAILGHVVLFLQKTHEVTVSELAFGVLFYGILLYWLLEHIFVKQERLTSEQGDSWLAAFFIVCLLSVVPALMYENNLFLWFREYLVFLGLLFYFPLRKALKSEQGQKIVLGTIIALAFLIAIKNIWEYRTRLSVASYAFEVLGGRQTTNEPLFMVMIIIGLAVYMVYTQPWVRFTVLAAVSFFSIALIMTFSRGYWVGAALGFLVLLWLGNPKERKRLIQFSTLLGVSALVILLVGFTDIFLALLSTIVSRLTSTATAIQDISFANRLVESSSVLELIAVNPFLGYGLGAAFTYHSILYGFAYEGEYVHNAYLFLWFKLGLPGLVIFMVAYLAKIVHGIKKLRSSLDKRFKPWVLAAVTTLIVMLLVSMTSPQFYARDSVLIIALCWAVIGASSLYTRQAAGERLHSAKNS
jgi:O-antigen ligase